MNIICFGARGEDSPARRVSGSSSPIHHRIRAFLRRGAQPALAVLISVSLAACVAADHGGSIASGAIQSPAGQAGQVGGDPAPPAVFLDTTYTRPPGRTIAVTPSGEPTRGLQAALDSARPGDVIALEAGATFSGNFTLPRKEGSGWIVIRTSATDDKLPPPGTRIAPAYASIMPKLVSPNADAVIATAHGAHHYRFVGIEFTTTPGWAKNHGLILFGDAAQKSASGVPHDLIIDRCYIHGNPNADLRRGIALNSASTAIIDSYISDVHEIGAESQAICGWNGPGPFKIVNNYLEAAGENVMFGGSDPRIPNLVPSDIEFRGNHCWKPLSWMRQHSSYAGKHWSVKNIFELKNARRVIVDGNLFENNWVDGQNGFAILFTVRNQEGTAPWCVIEDVAFTNNILRHSAAGINLLGRDDNYPSEQLKRVLIKNNLFEDIGGKQWGGNGRFVQITETVEVTIDHNTVLHTGTIITAYGVANKQFSFTNNIVLHNEYGVIGDGSSIGNSTLDKYFPDRVFRRNVIAGGRGSLYPSDNFFPATIDEAEFADRKAGNYKLTSSSPYKTAGTDSKSIGCDVGALKAGGVTLESGRSSLDTNLNDQKRRANEESTSRRNVRRVAPAQRG